MLTRLKSSTVLEPAEIDALVGSGQPEMLNRLPIPTIKLLVHAVRSTREIPDPTERQAILKKIASEPQYAAERVFEPFKVQNEVNREALRGKVDVAKSSVRCKKCGEQRVIQFQKQIGSSDEAMTTFYECTNCLFSWKGSR